MKVLEPIDGNKYLIVYHREDNDGLFSMAIMYQHLIRKNHVDESDIDLFGANYDEMSRVDIKQWLKKYNHIVMTDISLPIDKMKKLYKKLENNFVYVDHHAPIIKECIANGLGDMPGQRLTDRSAIMNMYEYLYNPFHLSYDDPLNKMRKPELFIILSAFDSFTFNKLGYGKSYVVNINTAVTNEFKLDPQKIVSYVDFYLNKIESDTQFANFDFDEKVRFHANGLEYNEIVDAEHFRIVSEYGSDFKVDGNRKAIAIFNCGAVGSGWFAGFENEYQHGIIFKRMKNGRWIISLYNIDDKDESFHCGEYLKKKYGGGGHVGAAGCQVDENTFIEILKKQKI